MSDEIKDETIPTTVEVSETEVTETAEGAEAHVEKVVVTGAHVEGEDTKVEIVTEETEGESSTTETA